MTQSSTRIRIRFTKTGELRWISHRDLARVWERLLRRAEIQLAFSQGFHPKPRISFPSALALGIEALDEVVELDVIGSFDPQELRNRVSSQAPPGMEVLSLDLPASKARHVASTFRIDLPEELLEECRASIARILSSESIETERDNGLVCCKVDQAFFDIRLLGRHLQFTLPIAEQGTSLRPSELLRKLGLGGLQESGAVLQRIRVHLADDGNSTSWDGIDGSVEPFEHHPSATLKTETKTGAEP